MGIVAKPVRLDHDAKRAALLSNPLFEAMKPDELDEVLRLSSQRRVPRGTSLFQKGDAGSSMMAVLTGRVRVSAVSAEGKEIMFRFVNPGEVFGEFALLDGKPRSADCSTIEETTLLVLERRHFLPFLRRNEDLYLRLLAGLCEKLRQTSTALEELALFDLPARLARVLLKLGSDYGRPVGKDIRIGLKMSQRDLSNLVASSRESVNKQLKVWRDDGVVDLDDGYLILRRPEELRALVE